MMERIDLESKTDIKYFQQGNAKLEILERFNDLHLFRFHIYRMKNNQCSKYTPSIYVGISYMRNYKINVILNKCNHFDV